MIVQTSGDYYNSDRTIIYPGEDCAIESSGALFTHFPAFDAILQAGEGSNTA